MHCGRYSVNTLCMGLVYVCLYTYIHICRPAKQRHHQLPCAQKVCTFLPHYTDDNHDDILGGDTFIKSTNNSGIFPPVFLQCTIKYQSPKICDRWVRRERVSQQLQQSEVIVACYLHATRT